MCTAATYHSTDFYFGRNLDLEYSYSETVTVTPRNFPFEFRMCNGLKSHFAMVGMAFVEEDYPLYYEAVNEKGLCMAGLNFPDNAVYFPPVHGMDNVTPFEFIPWILGQCENLEQARRLLSKINLANIKFSDKLPLSPLHWIIADKSGAVTVESIADGLKIHENPVGILTNNPTFDFHIKNLSNYAILSSSEPESDTPLSFRSHGMGAIGLPGDWSSASRFVRAAFVKKNSVSGKSEGENIGHFFRILGSVEVPKGCVRFDGKLTETVYSCCCNADKGIYYYKTCGNSRISAVDMHKENLNGDKTVSYPLIAEQDIYFNN